MAYELNWQLLGQPVDVGGAVRRGFETGARRSALAALVRDPTDANALSNLAMFDPEAAISFRDKARTETFRREARSAFDPATGNIDPAAMRRAYANAGDISGALEFDRTRAQTQRTQQEADRDRLRRFADLLDDSSDPASYAQNRALALQLGADPAAIPEQYDPQWVAGQRRIVQVLQNPREMTTSMREFEASGGNLNTPEGQAQFRQFLLQRQPMQAVDITQPDGSVVRQYMQRPTAGGTATPSELTDDDIRRLDTGGPAPAAGPATFP